MSRDEPEFSILKREAGALFAELVSIYREAIVAPEQKPVSELAGMLADPRYSFLIASIEGRTVGFVISYLRPGANFWLLEYVAVDPRLRSHGLGRRLFDAAESAAAEVVGNAPCLLEVDQPSPKGTPDDDAVRRLRFYRRAGCRRVQGLNYILPLDVAGPPSAMWLLVRGLERQERVAKADVANWLTEIYVEVYGQDADDPRISKMLSFADGDDDLMLVDLD